MEGNCQNHNKFLTAVFNIPRRLLDRETMHGASYLLSLTGKFLNTVAAHLRRKLFYFTRLTGMKCHEG